ncbi:MAG: hypothetical protein DRJ55_06435 [Thermoprotei archaeon]|nr:MAG: hypothetical protein DRJ55_06435 [Thermoprotei archaeon]
MNGPGEPGYSGTTSDEARAPANALDILVNAYFLTGDPKYLEAARKVVKESHFNSKWYRDGPNPDYADRTVAPWQVLCSWSLWGGTWTRLGWLRGG